LGKKDAATAERLRKVNLLLERNITDAATTERLRKVNLFFGEILLMVYFSIGSASVIDAYPDIVFF
jgi:hypothetical protein